MEYTIKQGHHEDTRIFSSWPHIGKTSMSRYVTFHESCAYELPAYNSLDVNKLFGLSFGFFAVHENSARFGWRWNAQGQCIDLLAYVYTNGKRNWDAGMNFPVVSQVRLGEEVCCSIKLINKEFFHFEVLHNPGMGFECVEHRIATGWLKKGQALPSYGLTHSLYFGGPKPAPHDMHITMSKRMVGEPKIFLPQ